MPTKTTCLHATAGRGVVPIGGRFFHAEFADVFLSAMKMF